MNAIKAFFANHKISTHSIAVVFMFLIGAYEKYPPFHDYVLSLYARIPSKEQALVTMLVGLYAWYRNGQKPSGQ